MSPIEMLLSVVLTLALLAGFFLWTRQRQFQRLGLSYQALEDRVHTIDGQLAMVGQAVLPISTAFQAILVKELTHFHTPRMDALLTKLGPPFTLTDAEQEELLAALKQREHDMGDLITDSERDAAHILPLVMRRAKIEAQVFTDTQMAFRLLTIAGPTTEDTALAQYIAMILPSTQKDA